MASRERKQLDLELKKN